MSARTICAVMWTTLLVGPAGWAAEPAPANPSDGKLERVVQVVQGFATGASAQDVEGLEQVLHKQSLQFVASPRGLVALDRARYLELVSSGKVGGDELTVSIERIHVHGDTASVEAAFEGSKATLRHSLSLLQGDEGWQILSSIVRVTATPVVSD